MHGKTSLWLLLQNYGHIILNKQDNFRSRGPKQGFLGDVLYGRAFLKAANADAVIISNHSNDERVSM